MRFYMLSQCPDSYVSLKGTGFFPLLLPPSLWKKTQENMPVNQHDHMQWYFQKNLRRKAFLFHSINLSSWPAFRLQVACTTLMLILHQTSSFMKAIFYLFGSLQSHESWKRNISTTHILSWESQYLVDPFFRSYWISYTKEMKMFYIWYSSI